MLSELLLRNPLRIWKYNKKARVSFLSYVKDSDIHPDSKIYRFSKVVNSSVGSFTYIAPGCSINNATIGRFCSIASGLKVGFGKHPISYVSTSPAFYSTNNALGLTFAKEDSFIEYESVTIGNDVWIGADVMILDGVKIGDGAIVAAKSLINKDVEPYSIVGGVPARHIKYRFENSVIERLSRSKWWDLPVESLARVSVLCQAVDHFLEEVERLKIELE